MIYILRESIIYNIRANIYKLVIFEVDVNQVNDIIIDAPLEYHFSDVAHM